MSWATRKWLETYGAGPDRQEVTSEISDWLNKGSELVVEYRCPRPFGPLTVVFEMQSPDKRKWVLDGLWPPECDTIRSRLLEEEWRDGPHPMHEMCVVVTLATLLHRRGIRLDPRTILYLHGKGAIFPCGVLSLPPYGRVSLAKAVEEDGWDVVADFLARQQDDLLRQVREPARRGPGRPRDDEFDQLVRARFPVLRNVQQVATEAAERFGGSIETAARRVRRTPYYRKLRRPPENPKRSTRSPRKATPDDRIERHLQIHDGATPHEIATALNLEERFVTEILRHQPDRFQGLPGDRWKLV